MKGHLFLDICSVLCVFTISPSNYLALLLRLLHVTLHIKNIVFARNHPSFIMISFQDLVAYAKAVDVVLHTHGDQPGINNDFFI